MMKRRNGEIVVKRSSRYAKRTTKSYTGEHFLSSNYGTVLKMLTLFCIVLFGDYCLGNFRLEYIWPLWLCMNSLMDAYKMQGLGFAVFFVGIVVTSDIICFLLVPVRWLFLVASSYVWLQYVISSERGLCIQTVVLWILFVYVESCIRVRELNRFLGSSSISSSAMFFAPPPSLSLWPDSGGDGLVASTSDSFTSQYAGNSSAEANSSMQQQQNDMAISAAAAASLVSSAASSTLSRIGGADMANDSSLSTSSTSPWLLWSLITSATPGFLGSSLPLRLELCRPLAAHCTGYPIIKLTTALKSFIAYRVKRSRQRQFAKENQHLKDLLFHALPDDVQQKQRSQLFSTFSLTSNSSSAASSGYSSMQQMQQSSLPSSLTQQQQLILSNNSAMPTTSSGAWLANNGLSELPNNGYSYTSDILSPTNTLHKSSSSGGFNSLLSGSSPAQQRATLSGSYLNEGGAGSSSSSTVLTTPVSAYAGNSSDTWTNNWTSTYAGNATSLDDGGPSSWLSTPTSMPLSNSSSNSKGGGAFQLRSSKAASSSRVNSGKAQSSRSMNSRSSATVGSSKNSLASMSFKSTHNSNNSSNKVHNEAKAPAQQQLVGTTTSAAIIGTSPTDLLQQPRPKSQPQFAIIAKLFSAIGSVLFSSTSSTGGSSRNTSTRRGSGGILPAPTAAVADGRKTAADGSPAATLSSKLRQKSDDSLLENDNEDDNSNIADDRSRHGARRRAENKNNATYIGTTHSSRSSSNSRSSGASFADTAIQLDGNYADDDRREPSSLSDNEFAAVGGDEDDDGVVVHCRNNSNNENDDDERDAVNSKRKSSLQHAEPPSYESLSLVGGGDATAVNDKMTTKNTNKSGGGRRRRAMTASTPTTTTSTATSDHVTEQTIVVTAEQHSPISSTQQNTTRLELEHKRLKNDLLESRQSEQDLRSQLGKVGIDQQSLRSDNVLLQKQNDSLQQRLHEMGSNRTREKKDAGAIEKKLAEETKKRTDAEKLLERERRAHAKDLEDSHKREAEVEKMRAKLNEAEQELLQIRQEFSKKEDEARKYSEENRRLEQYRSAQKDTDVLLSALSAMQDKNMHMENSLTAETKLKLELFTALGDAKKDLDQYKSLVFKRETEIKDLRECVKRLSAAAAVAQQQQQPKQQPATASVMPTSSMTNNTSLADVLSNGFSAGLGLSNGTANKSNNMARLNSLSVLDHPHQHKFDSLGSTLGHQHFGGGSAGGLSSVTGGHHHMHQLNHHQQTLNDALASFGSASSSSPGFLHEYTSANSTSTPPVGSQGGNVGSANGLFGEFGYGHSYYAAAVQGGNNSTANRSTPSPSSVPGSAAAAAALQGGGNNMRSSPSINNNGSGVGGSSSSSNFSRW